MKQCENCLYSEAIDWKQDVKTGKATAVYWCEIHHNKCNTIRKCKHFDDGSEGE